MKGESGKKGGDTTTTCFSIVDRLDTRSVADPQSIYLYSLTVFLEFFFNHINPPMFTKMIMESNI